MRLWIVILLILSISGGAALANQPGKPVSTKTLDVATLNDRLRSLARTEDPISLTLKLIGGVAETPRARVETVSDPKTDFNRVTVIIVRDGFQDDSMRGDWHEFRLMRAADGAWAIGSARRAFRCWRGTFKGYSAKLCP